MKTSPRLFLLSFLVRFFLFFVQNRASSSIVYTTLGRSLYGFDIYATPIQSASSSSQPELLLTDGVSINYNGFFPSSPSTLLSLIDPSSSSSSPSDSIDALIYVTERSGQSTIYLDFLPTSSSPSNRRETLDLPTRLHFPLFPQPDGRPSVSMKDRPSLFGDRLIFVSTHEPSHSPRQSWAAVYSTHVPTGATTRLTPNGISDFSPAVSPSGRWTAVASSGERGWTGEVQELNTDIYVFNTIDGSARTLVVRHGGWPCWADDSAIYFHRLSSDGWWSVYRAAITTQDVPDLISLDRITPPGFHAFTPAVSAAAPELIAVATRRASSQFRHIELIDLREGRNAYVEVTRPTTPFAHHFNPFFSPDADRIGYHRCRGNRTSGNPPLILENIKSLSPEKFSLLRIDGSFPSFSPDGHRIAYVKLPGVYVVNSDGSNPKKIYGGNAFGTAWDWKRKGVIYTSHGPHFAPESTEVDIISITLSENDDKGEAPLIKKLTSGGKNNAFPSPSPDGKWVVFRSGRSGYKNLYVMDAVEGESAGIYQLTEGPWSDTMCNWSPNGEWIAFASDRDDPENGSFSIYMMHPNGTGLRKVVHSGDVGRTNHPWFSPDSASLVFTSEYAGVSAEPISNPHHYQPAGEIFTVNSDGSEIRRLTHDSYEDGTPTWTSLFLKRSDVAESLQGVAFCGFDDCHWLSLQNQIHDVLNGTTC